MTALLEYMVLLTNISRNGWHLVYVVLEYLKFITIPFLF